MAASGILGVFGASNATIRDLTLTDGNRVGNSGGALYSSSSSMVLQRVHVKDSLAQFGGGVFFDGGTILITGSTFSGNTAEIGGGGIYNAGDLVVIGSTFSENQASGGGAIVSASYLTITDSTITDNLAASDGGGGLYNAGVNMSVRSTIVAGNYASAVGDSDVFPATPITSLGYNLVGVGNGLFTATGDQQGTIGSPLDAKLAPLGNNGGTTPTHSLLAGSPAIDAGFSTEGTDQRGLTRVVDQPGFANVSNGADIGAYELQAPTAAPVRVTGRVTNRYGRGVTNATVYFTDMSGAAKYARTNTFGYFTVTDLPAGDSYVVTVKTRTGLVFEPRMFTPTDDLDGLNFVAR